ncbi:MAG: VWA domain-containing protein [Bacteroidetes bacterium]|nr:VWA domain-containing protein [Bacteroidota bacterium]
MKAVQFQYPLLFWLLLLLLPMAAMFIGYLWYRKKQLKNHFHLKALKRQTLIAQPKSEIKRMWLYTVIVSLSIIGMANLQFGSKMEYVKTSGSDIVVAIDLSKSMDATDLIPSRLDKSKLFINELINELAGERLGLVVFAGTAFLQCPLTTDYSALKMFVSTLETDLMPSQGTSIAEAIKTAIEAFDPETPQGKNILVISDGEEHEGGLDDVIEEANDLGIVVSTIGVGTSAGKPIPVIDRFGRRGYQRDENNKIITTKLDEIMLRDVAHRGSGSYFRLNNSAMQAKEYFASLNNSTKANSETKIFTEYESRFYWFFLAALVLLLIDYAFVRKRVDE